MDTDEKYPAMPPLIIEGLRKYADNHLPVGGFLTAVLENNLTEAIVRADMFSLAGIKDIVMYVHWEIPGDCHGSPQAVRAWLSKDSV